MQKLSSQWAFFARMQRDADRSQITNLYWATDDAADAALDLITASSPQPLHVITEQIRTLTANRTAKHRRRGEAVAKYLAPMASAIIVPSPADAVAANIELERVKRLVLADEWQLLEMIAVGESHADIADALGVVPGTVTNRLSLLRRRLLN